MAELTALVNSFLLIPLQISPKIYMLRCPISGIQQLGKQGANEFVDKKAKEVYYRRLKMTGVDFSRAESIIMKSELDGGIITKSVFDMATVEVVGMTGGDFLCPGSIIMKSAFNFAVVEYHEPILVSIIVLLQH